MLLGVHYCLAGAKYVTKNSIFQFWGSKNGKKNVEIKGVGPIWRDPRRNSAEFPAGDVQNGWMATQLVPKRCDFGSLGVPGPASTPKPTNQSIFFIITSHVWPSCVSPRDPFGQFVHHHRPCVAIMCHSLDSFFSSSSDFPSSGFILVTSPILVHWSPLKPHQSEP